MTIDELTPRQIEVIRLMQKGFSVDQIAAKLSIATRTVGSHRANIFRVLRKYGIKNKQQLLNFASEKLSQN